MPDNFSDWGNLASIVGLGVSIVGFAFTLWSVSRSKKATQQAMEAVEKAREDIFRSNKMIDLASAMTIMEEIKRLHGVGAWHILPDRYASLRNALTCIRTSKPSLPDEHKAVIQGAIEQLRIVENKIERALASTQNPGNVPRLNEIVSLQIDKVAEVLVIVRSERNA